MKALTILVMGLAGAALQAGELEDLLVPLPSSPAALPVAGVPAAKPAAEEQWLTESEVVGALQEALRERWALHGEFQLSLVRAWVPCRVAAKPWRLLVTDAPGAGPASSMVVSFSIAQNGKTLITWTTLVRAQLRTEVWVTSRQLRMGEPLDSTTLQPTLIDVLKQPLAPVATTSDLAPYELAHTLGGGKILTWRDLSGKQLVRKGAEVEIAATEGTLNITLRGMALSDGAEGEVITIRNRETRRDFRATVIGKNRAQVRF